MIVALLQDGEQSPVYVFRLIMGKERSHFLTIVDDFEVVYWIIAIASVILVIDAMLNSVQVLEHMRSDENWREPLWIGVDRWKTYCRVWNNAWLRKLFTGKREEKPCYTENSSRGKTKRDRAVWHEFLEHHSAVFGFSHEIECLVEGAAVTGELLGAQSGSVQSQFSSWT